MRRTAFVFLLCVVTCSAAISARAGSGRVQATASAASSSSAGSASKTATARKTTTTSKKRHHTATKFVPKQKVPTSDRITEIQTALAHGGYYQGDPNGRWDGNSIAAMQKFQSANGLEASGKLDAPSLQKLGLGSDIAGVSAPKPRVPSSNTPAGAAPSTPAASSVNTTPVPATAAAISPAAGALASKSAQQ